MRLKFLGKGGSDTGDCPSLYVTDRPSYVVQGWQTEDPESIEIPHLLTGFAEPGTFIGATMTDTGRGTFTLSGRPITESETLAQMDLAPGESAVEVPKLRRTYYGALPAE